MIARKVLFLFFSLFVIFGAYKVSAATTGIIDPSNSGNFKVTILNAGLAGNDVINFGKFTTQSAYNITVTSTELRGYAWGEGVGWIVLNCADTTSGCSGTNGNFKVANTPSGLLSGYAWGENTGWINFGPFTNPAISTVKIDTSTGLFGGTVGTAGYAWSQNYGWLQFDCTLTDSCVETNWRPAGPPPLGGGVVILPPPPPPPIPDPIPLPVPTPEPLPPNPTPIPQNTPEIRNPIKDPLPDSEDIQPDEPPFFERDDQLPPPDGPGDRDVRDRDTTEIARINTLFGTISNRVRSGVSTGTAGDMLDFLSRVREGYRGIAETMEGVGVTLLGSVVLFSTLQGSLGTIFAFRDIPFLILRAWNALLIFFKVKRKVRPWGTVFDSVTKQPLDPAYISLLDSTGQEVASAITDMDGRFGFIVGAGKYTITVKKSNYEFPSQKLAGRSEDELYTDLYFGEQVEVTEEGEVLYKNIPLDQLAFDWNEFAKQNQKRLTYFRRRDVAFARISEVLFIAGFVFSLYSFFAQRTTLSTIIVVAYIVMYFLRKSNPVYRVKGAVYANNELAPFSIIRFLSHVTKQEVAHKVTTSAGEYYAILPNGEYAVTVDVKNPDGGYTKKEYGLNAKVTKGFYRDTIRV